MKYIFEKRFTLGSIAVIVPLGFATKIYEGPASGWVNNSLGGILYVICWCLLFSLPFRRAKGRTVAAAVFIATCLIELLQLWHPPLLEAVRTAIPVSGRQAVLLIKLPL